MVDPTLISQISRLPMFAPLNAMQLERVAGIVQRGEFAAGHVVFREGEPARGLYAFVSGIGVLSRGTPETPIAQVAAGQFLNERALQREVIESATLRIVEPSVVLLIARVNFLTLIDQHPDIWLAMRSRSAPVSTAPPSNLPIPPAPSGAGVTPPAGSTYPIPGVGGVTVPTGPTPPTGPSYPIPGVSGVTMPIGSTPPASSAPLPVPPPPPTRPAAPPAQQVYTQPAAPPPAEAPVSPTPAPGPAGRVPTGIARAQVPDGAAPPANAAFRGQHPDEIVLAQIYPHRWVFLRHLWMPALLLVLLFGLSFIITVPLVSGVLTTLGVFLPGLWVGYLFVEWRNDKVILTSERVIRIRQTLFPYDNSTTIVNLANIHEVSAEYPPRDVFARLMNYGSLRLRTTGDAGDMLLTYVPAPQQVQQVLFQQRERGSASGGILADHPAVAGAVPVPTAPPAVRVHPLALRYEDAEGSTVYRKHWLVWLSHVLLPIGLILIGILGIVWVLFTSGDLLPVTLPVALVPLLIGAVWFYFADWDWRNDLYIVGEDVLTVIHRRPFFQESSVDKVMLEQVDSIAVEQNGLLNALFNIGDVRLSLEGADRGDVKRFASVFNPRAIQEQISLRQQQARQRAQQAQHWSGGSYITSAGRPYMPPGPNPAGGGGGGGPAPQNPTRPPNVPRKRGSR